MSVARASRWSSLGVCKSELLLQHTLPNGQCFNWNELTGTCKKTWTGVLGRRVIALRQDHDDVSFKCLNLRDKEDQDAAEAELKITLEDYFQLGTKLQPLYEQWSAGDERMKQVLGSLCF